MKHKFKNDLSQETLARLMDALCEVMEQEPFVYQKWHGCDQMLLHKLRVLAAEAR